MRELILIFVSVLLLLMPFAASGQNQISRPGKKTEQSSGTKKNRANRPSGNKSEETKEAKPETPQVVEPAFVIAYSEPDGEINGHGYVDLGLPSGTLWATCNVGGTLPENFGNYFAYAETEPKFDYTPRNSVTLGKNKVDCWLNEYFMVDKGCFNSNNELASTCNAAKVNWGRSWDIPSKNDWDELKKSCTWTWVSDGKMAGYLITGPNNKSIFLRAGGLCRGVSVDGSGKEGNYISRDADNLVEKKDKIYAMTFNEEMRKVSSMNPYFGYSLRPVIRPDLLGHESVAQPAPSEISEADGSINGYSYIDLGLPSGNKWALCNLGASQPEEKGKWYLWSEPNELDRHNTKRTASQDKTIAKLKAKKIVDADGNLTLEHDAAYAKMGANWRIPTKDDFKELLECCEWIRASHNDEEGWMVIGPNGHVMFIPHINAKNEKYHLTHYWAATASENPAHAVELTVTNSDVKIGGGYRNTGSRIRPVAK